MSKEILQEAIVLAREGRKAEARWLLERVLRDDRENETAWLWYADCVETYDERLAALESCLRANPNALRARAGLRLLLRSKPAAAAGPVAAQVHGNGNGKSILSRPPARENVGELAASVLVAVTGGSGAAAPAAANGHPARVEPGELVTDPFTEPPEQLFAEVWGVNGSGADNSSVMNSEGVFTVPPDSVPDEEFAEIEAREGSFLDRHADLRPLHAERAQRGKPARQIEEQDWDDLSQVGSPRLPASFNAPTRPIQRTDLPDDPQVQVPVTGIPMAVKRPSIESAPTRPVRRPLSRARRVLNLFIVVMFVMMLAVLLGAALAIGLA